MLFSTYEFIFGFLPAVLAGYWLLARHDNARLWFLLAASVIFYSLWDWRFAPLLIGSIIINWTAVQGFFVSSRRAFLFGAIVANLTCLGIFKYLGFLESIVSSGTGWNPSLARLALPLGISFFTFHHIIYLADLNRGNAPRYSLRDYALYIALFPQILAGPLVRHREIIPQFADSPLRPGWQARISRGIALFLIGLGKKLFFADSLANHADSLFAKAAAGVPSMGEAWTAALAFPFQIYFDFSGYSDMAIGLALLLGFALPFNFAAPYRATSLQEFWRRWHMTLTRFLRDYLYIPFGGNRQGLPGHVAAIFLTLVLGGLWHGAGWTFVIWGALHGAGLSAGVLWRRWLPPLPKTVSWPLLMAFLIVTWVFFRAPSLSAATNLFTGMTDWGHPGLLRGWQLILAAAAFALIGPTSQELVERLRPWRWLVPVAAIATVVLLLKMGDGPAYEFIYFHF